MIDYPLQAMLNIDIDEVMIVTDSKYVNAFQNYLGDGKHLGFSNLTLSAQYGANGIADALSCANNLQVNQMCASC